MSTAVQVLILQHPDESGHAKNTARLLHLSLPNSRLEIGEQFHEDALAHWLQGNEAHSSTPPTRPVLLYPPTPPDPQLAVPAPPALPPEWLTQPAQLRLVVLDGTWRKSRKMLYLNPLLQQLPRLALHDLPENLYAIRKAHKPGQLSTLQACTAALQQLEPHNPTLGRLLASMQALQHHHLAVQAHHSRHTPA